jgi:carbon monoxide dehydrogenase subunit G
MQLEHRFTVPASVDEAWAVLLDIERVAPCLPGATLDSSEGGTYTGRVKVKVGPIQITYTGKAEFTEIDEVARRAVMSATGREVRGSGTARATVTMNLQGDGDKTDVQVLTDLAVTGRPAQFGRGVMADVGERLIGRFADCLAQLFVESPAAEAEPAAVAGTGTAVTGTQEIPPSPTTAEHAGLSAAAAEEVSAAGARGGAAFGENEPVDLLEVAGLPVAKRVLPVVAVLAVLIAIWAVFRRRR